MSNISSLARGSFAVLVLGAALSATAQTQTPQGSSGSTSPGSTSPGAATGAGAAANTSATLDAAFKRADTNGDGKLSADELKQIPALASRFSDLDKDKDGSVSSTEFSAGVTVKSN
jgi:hypothetical protein